VSLPIENRESALRIFDAFHIHRQEVLDDFWDESEFQDLQATSTIESWSNATHLLRRLWRHLPFGRHVTRGLRILREQLFLRLLLTTRRASEYTLDFRELPRYVEAKLT
jgi:hypothetical protein